MKTDYDARILADSVNTATGDRLTTFELTMPRFVLAEFNTHRMLSRNSASSRAIPVRKRIEAVRENPFVPMAFGKRKRGMQAGEALDDKAQMVARSHWLEAARVACKQAAQLAEAGVHKQWANRLVEPYCWHTVIASATEWENFFALRCHPMAQPEIRIVAELAQELYRSAEPMSLQPGWWHLPMVREDELAEICAARVGGDADTIMRWVKISAGRCARVSYLTHDGKRDPDADVALCERLVSSGHMSPLEHPAVAMGGSYGNYTGWLQYRKQIPGEAIYGSAP